MAEHEMQSTSFPPWGGATNDRWEQMFPTLSTVQMAELEPFGTQRVYEAGGRGMTSRVREHFVEPGRPVTAGSVACEAGT